jgi:hypothetical protein
MGLGSRAVQEEGQGVAEKVERDQSIQSGHGNGAALHGQEADRSHGDDQGRQDAGGIQDPAAGLIRTVAG